jgi:hypothetical protein
MSTKYVPGFYMENLQNVQHIYTLKYALWKPIAIQLKKKKKKDILRGKSCSTKSK